jgi:hypothetical protein
MGKRLLLHIGYHKTATSWMQQRLFVPEHGYRQIARHAEVWQHVVGKHGLLFDAEEMRAALRHGLSDLRDGEVPVVSSEILSGHPFFGGIGSDVFAERLREIAPESRILISIRHQRRMLTSVYMQYLSRGGTMSPEKFFAGDPDLGFYGFRPEHFEYHRLVAHYQSLFGAGNVYVLSQESLARDMDEAARRLAEFAGNDTFEKVLPTHRAVYAPSYPEYAVPLLRRINKFQKSVLTPAPTIRFGTTPKGIYRMVGAGMRRPPFSMVLKGYRPVSGYVERHFVDHFDESNRMLIEMIGQDLHWPGTGSAARAESREGASAVYSTAKVAR